MSTKYSAEDLAEMQTTLVQEYLEIAADASREAHPDSLRVCAMLLAGAAELADPPAAPEPEPEPVPVYDETAESAQIDALLPECDPSPEELTEAVSASGGPFISFDTPRPPESIVAEDAPPTYKTPAEYLRSLNEITLQTKNYEMALKDLAFIREVLDLAAESSRPVDKKMLRECHSQLGMVEWYLKKEQFDL